MLLSETLQSVRLSLDEQLEHIRRIQATGDPESWDLMLRQFNAAIFRFAGQGNMERRLGRESVLLEKFVRAMLRFDTDSGHHPSTYLFRCFQGSINESEFQGPIRTPAAAWKTYTEDYTAAVAQPVRIMPHDGSNLADKYNELGIDDDPADDIQRRSNIDAVRDAIDQLPDRNREVVRRRMTGETLKSIGDTLGISKERVRQLEARGKDLLRELLEPLNPTPDADEE